VSDAAIAPASSRLRRVAIIWCAATLLIFSLTGRFAWSHKCVTFDEPLHLVSAWFQTHHDDLRCNPEDPPLWKYYVAAGTRASDLVAKPGENAFDAFHTDLLYHGSSTNDVDGLLAAGRARMILLGALLGAIIAWWAWRLAGPIAAMVAVTAYGFDPNFLAHAPLIKNDVPITLVFVSLMAIVWLLGERATFLRWLMVGLLTGAAMTTKFSGILAIPLLGIALFLRAIFPGSWKILRWNMATRWRRLGAAMAMGLAALLVAAVVIWGSYRFRFLPTTAEWNDPGINQVVGIWAEHQVFREHGYPLHVKLEQVLQWTSDWRPDPFIRTIQWIHSHRLLPQTWLVGFVYTSATSVDRATFLLGRVSTSGCWYYFPAAMAFKTPLATLLGLTLAIAWMLWRMASYGLSRIRTSIAANAWLLCATLLAPVLYMLAAMNSNLNLGIRHILPVYPFLFILLGVVAARAWQRRPPAARWVIVILAAGLAIETFSAYPNYIPFFNVVATSWRSPLYLLGDSNIDWGQELPDLADWQSQHEDRQLFLSYFGAGDPAYYGIHYRRMGGAYSLAPGNEMPVRLKPVFAISAVSLQGQYLSAEDQKLYDPFRHQKPLTVLGGSLYIFDLPPELDPAGQFDSSRPVKTPPP
jgi:4-amino-4-deoxy-L-arabinose transferase-like glycosyltransferase